MDFTIGTSRWTGVAKILNREHGIPSTSCPGKELDYITDQAIALVKHHRYNNNDNTFVYITAGLTNLTEKVSYGYGRNRYQEVMFYEEVMTAVNRVYDSFERSRDRILMGQGVVPVYSTVVPMSFWDWNYARLCQGKTTRIDHVEDYLVMQADHEEAIVELNNKIRTLNARYDLLTPRIANYVFQKKGADQPHRLRHNRLVDGVHPTDDTINAWTEEILSTMSLNHVRANLDFNDSWVSQPENRFNLIDISDSEDNLDSMC